MSNDQTNEQTNGTVFTITIWDENIDGELSYTDKSDIPYDEMTITQFDKIAMAEVDGIRDLVGKWHDFGDGAVLLNSAHTIAIEALGFTYYA